MEFDANHLSRVLERDELAVEDQLALGVHFGVLEGERALPNGEITTPYRFPSADLGAGLARELDPGHLSELQQRLVAEDAAPSSYR